MKIDIVGVKYDGPNMDFSKLIGKSDRTLFLFNDNWTEHYTDKKGGGNAVIRPYNPMSNLTVPKSFGIPTGYYRSGYQSLNEGKQAIDKSFEELEALIATGNYDRIVYSIENHGNCLIGRGIFVISEDVKCYITKRILSFGLGCRYYFLTSQTTDQIGHEITNSVVDSFGTF